MFIMYSILATMLDFFSWQKMAWLQIRRPAFDSRHYQKKSSVSGTGSTQPREYNWGATWQKSSGSLYPQKLDHFANKRRSLSWYSSLVDSAHGVFFLGSRQHIDGKKAKNSVFQGLYNTWLVSNNMKDQLILSHKFIHICRFDVHKSWKERVPRGFPKNPYAKLHHHQSSLNRNIRAGKQTWTFFNRTY
jgi:hypothetical protein